MKQQVICSAEFDQQLQASLEIANLVRLSQQEEDLVNGGHPPGNTINNGIVYNPKRDY
ncbi:hypothetical protein [Chromobacterium sp. IIBBL 290-4]|uniref:hypothetical protein n=1 Tax=Chromobacterium sp. IIBBL 290-4 TaxID=2953890 RepID=UPI0020B82C20|nr:hypothetical protein [Chromobacterium sp. IIBBL 290-4]UTH75780.1 hypothetical protein NKT35_06680 [Chromobacterium sp. IIBBL 290-4]